jgi:hypothetical protein
MTEAMKITLTAQPADARWGEKASYSINNDGIALHLNGKDDLGLIQRAARKLTAWASNMSRLTAKAGIPIAHGRSGPVIKAERQPQSGVAGPRRCAEKRTG